METPKKTSDSDDHPLSPEQEFTCRLYQDVMEEASWLYEQSVHFHDDVNVTWMDRDDFDRRFEKYIRVLMAGNDLGLRYCTTQAKEGDAGELHAAVRVFCRQNRQDLIDEVLGTLDLSDDKKVKAVSDALGLELPRDLHELILRPLFDKGPEYALIAARVCAFQRLDFERECLKALEIYPSNKPAILALLHALGRIRLSVSAVVILVPFLTHEDKDIAQAAIHTLVRTGESRHAEPIAKDSWPVMSIALSKDGDAYPEILSHPDPNEQKTLALGILGDIRAVPELISRLGDPETAENAALSLFLITGAELYEDHFIPDEIDPDTLFPDELEKYNNGELYAPGEEPGETVRRIAQNPETWQTFWDENQGNFESGQRYRNGKPFAPESLIETLRSEKSPDTLRKLAWEELVIRFNIDTPFETAMIVKDQLKAIEATEKQIRPVELGLGNWE